VACVFKKGMTKRNVLGVDIKQIRVLRLRFFLQALVHKVKGVL